MRRYSDEKMARMLLALGGDPGRVGEAIAFYQAYPDILWPTAAMDRREALARARQLFIRTGITREVGRALDLYQRLFAHRSRPVKITRGDCTERMSPFDGLARPRCPDCNREMRIAGVNNCRATRVGGPWRSVWCCPAERECGYCEYSRRTVGEWYAHLTGQEARR